MGSCGSLVLSFRSFQSFLESGGDSSAVADELTEVEGICASGKAFAALRSNGTVVAWGHKGNMMEEILFKK